MSYNTWLHKISRTFIVQPLIKTAVAPNKITGLRLITGLGAAGCILIGETFWLNLGAGLFIFSMLLDRADGDYARLTEQTSALGHKFDLVSDAICNSLIFVGLGVGLRNGVFGPWSLVMGVIAGVSVAVVLILVVWVEKKKGDHAGEIKGFAGFDPDDAMIMVPVLIWGGWSDYLLVSASVGAPFFAVIFAYIASYRIR